MEAEKEDVDVSRCKMARKHFLSAFILSIQETRSSAGTEKGGGGRVQEMMQRCKQSFKEKESTDQGKALGLQTVRACKAGGASGYELRRTWNGPTKKTAIKVVGECGQVTAITEGRSVPRKKKQ